MIGFIICITIAAIFVIVVSIMRVVFDYDYHCYKNNVIVVCIVPFKCGNNFRIDSQLIY